MKKVILVIILISLILSGCTDNNQNSELIRISNCDSKIVTIEGKTTVEEIKEIFNSVKYVEESLKLENENYKIWLENSNSDERIFNFKVWVNNDNVIVFNSKTGNYGYIIESRINTIKEILASVS